MSKPNFADKAWYVAGPARDKVAFKAYDGLSFLIADCRHSSGAAPLIAAAPEMLAALIAMRDLMVETGQLNDYRVCEQMMAAIAKAEGNK